MLFEFELELELELDMRNEIINNSNELDGMDGMDVENNVKYKLDGKKRKRANKSELYGTEREKLIEELEKLMNLDENGGVYLYELNRNENMKNYLKRNEELIKKIYRTCNWSYMIKSEEKRNEVGLLKSIYKNSRYNLVSQLKYADFDGIHKKYTFIYFLKQTSKN